MRYVWVAALVLGVVPAVASAGHRFGTFDRGLRYSGGHSRSNFSFGVSIGLGNGFYAGYSSGYRGHGYGYGGYSSIGYCEPVYRPIYRAPVVCAPPVVYTAPVYYTPPVYYSAPVYYSTPVYYSPPVCSTDSYYMQTQVYYYGR